MGRFSSVGRIGVWGDLGNWGNGYTYVGNHSLSEFDPLGLRTWGVVFRGSATFKLDVKFAEARARLDPDGGGVLVVGGGKPFEGKRITPDPDSARKDMKTRPGKPLGKLMRARKGLGEAYGTVKGGEPVAVKPASCKQGKEGK